MAAAADKTAWQKEFWRLQALLGDIELSDQHSIAALGPTAYMKLSGSQADWNEASALGITDSLLRTVVRSAAFDISNITTAGPHDLTGTATRRFLVAYAPGTNVVLQLPDLSVLGTNQKGWTVFVYNFLSTSVEVQTGAVADKIVLPVIGSVDDVKTVKPGSYFGLTALPSAGLWAIVDGNGEWFDVATPADIYNWDGNVAGASLRNLVRFDTNGTIEDSGIADSDVTLVDGSRPFTGTVGGVTPTADAHLTTKGYVDGKVQGLDWQDSVQHNISYLKTGSAGAPTGGTGETSGEKALNTNDGKLYTYTASWDAGVAVSTDERFIFKDDGTGGGFSDGTTPTADDKIREYNGSTFDETTPNEGFAVWVEDQDKQYNFNGTAWVTFGSTVTHNNTSGIQGGNSTERYHLTATEHTGTGTGALVRETSPTIVTPTIASMTNAQHNHSNAAGGGTIAHSVTTGQTANDHHNQVHDLAGSDHNSATLAQLNAKISDATLDDSSSARTPTAHAASHESGGSDELELQKIAGSYTRHIDLPASAAGFGPTAPTDVVDNTFFGKGFDADAETAYLNFEVPDDWDGASDMAIRVYWFPPTGGSGLADTETVKWDASYRSVAPSSTGGETTDNGTLVTATATHTQSGAGSVRQTYETDITIDYDNANQPLTKGDTVAIEFTRDVTGDTFGGQAVVFRWEIVFTANRVPQH